MLLLISILLLSFLLRIKVLLKTHFPPYKTLPIVIFSIFREIFLLQHISNTNIRYLVTLLPLHFKSSPTIPPSPDAFPLSQEFPLYIAFHLTHAMNVSFNMSKMLILLQPPNSPSTSTSQIFTGFPKYTLNGKAFSWSLF